MNHPATDQYIPPVQGQRDLWQARTEKASDFIARGDIHLGLLAVSACSFLIQYSLYLARRLWIKPDTSDQKIPAFAQFYTPFAYHIIQISFATGSFALSVATISHQGSWRRALLLGYATVLYIGRFAGNSSIQTHVFRHVNTIVLVATLLSIIQTFIPVFIVGATYRPGALESALFACLFATITIPAISPRPQRTLYHDDEINEDINFSHKASLEETCSLFSYYVSYEWMTWLILRGLRKELTIDDLPILPSYDAPIKWFQGFKERHSPGSNTFFTLCRLLKKDIRQMICWSALIAFTEFLAPSALMRLLGYLQDPVNAIIHPLVWIAILLLGPAIRTLCFQSYIFVATRLLVRVNMALVQAIYHTAVRSHIYDSSVAERKVNHGGSVVDKELSKGRQADITTLMSSDVQAIYNGREIFFAPVVVPITVICAVIYLYRLLGWPSLFGVATLFLLSPLPTLASRRVSRIQTSVMQATDARISKITEYLGSIRTLKYFGWEPAMEKEVDVLRQVEQSRVWKRNLTAAFISLAADLLPMMSLLVSFAAVVLFTETRLDAPKAFTAMSIMEILRLQCFYVSNIVRNASTSLESLRRLDRFFDSAVEIKRHPCGPPAFYNATFRRTPVADFRLHDITVAFTESALNVVTGSTGSGKTSLLLSLIGETILESGEATCPRDVAYVPQTAWLQNDTVRQNILFYSDFDQTHYDNVVAACGLLQDLQQLPDGDMTVVGERGTSLSGGQKQRVSLARAIYSQSSTLLLDDVFSALDTHTTAWVYEQCFRSGLLAGRTVILVTHLPSALEDARTVIHVENGTIASIRTNKDSVLVSYATSTISNDLTVAEASGVVTPQNNGEADTNKKAGNGDSSENQTSKQQFSSRLVAEQSSGGRLPRSTGFEYLLKFGGISFVFFAILSTLALQVAYFSTTYWLSIWADAYDRTQAIPNVRYYLSIYAATIFAYLALEFGNVVIFQAGGWNAARKMHRKLLHAILQAPVSWFDQNPVGRAMNRFGNDIRSMDTVLPDYLSRLIDNCLRFLFRVASIASVMPMFIIPACIICSMGIVVGEMYTRTQFQVKRLASINASPVFIHFIDSIAGMSVIRARGGMDEKFFNLLSEKVGVLARTMEAQFNSNRWVSVRLDWCAALLTATVGLLAWKVGGDPGLVGFSLSHAVGLGQTILVLIRNLNDLEVELISYQRVKEYAEIENEEQEELVADQRRNQIPAHWPRAGQVEFSNVTAKYHDGPNILQNINFTINPGERVGIVGRTGSGKSTLGLTLLRFTELASGQVRIDGIDISKIPLNRLRTSIALIPQDPVLFSGDVRSNLDPFGELGETELQAALSACCSSIEIASITGGSNDEQRGNQPQSLRLDTPVAANGENFSQGQRQVLGLARAVSRRAKVVLLDEATASVDRETDEHIQRLIRTEFPDSTIIAIAHRLRTVVDYDRIIVMGGGEILEMGSPAELVDRDGLFCDMLQKTGEYDELVQMIRNVE